LQAREPDIIPAAVSDQGEDRRAYITFQAKRRLHQARFRAVVLRTYRERCAICSLRRQEFLDAAHILPDSHPRGQPVVQNGLALCKLHHSAYDGNFLGIRPDYVIEIRRDLLEEQDGPVLLHGLKGFHDQSLKVPSIEACRPDPARLAERFDEFKKAI
jgi:putative restriction endonuclease